MKILIAGGGIGGLTAALCALHQGFEATVFERAKTYEPIGAGIQLSPNAMKVFRAIGLEDAITAKAFQPNSLQARMGRSGREMFNISLANHKWGAPYLHIHRAALMEILVSALNKRAPYSLQMGREARGYDGGTLLLNDTEVTGDIIIAADGIKSLLRQQMIGPQRAEFTGNVAWRAVMSLDALGEHAPPPTACVWMGPKRHAVTYRLGQDNLVNFVGVVERDDWQGESWTERGAPAELQADFAGWHPVIDQIIQNVPPDKLFKWALFDRPPLDDWVEGRTVLLGDAAHPMLPFMAQGAAMAIEDGWVLMQALKDNPDPEAVLNSYQLQRQPRTARAQRQSRANMGLYHKKNALSQALTYGPMWLGGKLAPQFARSRLDWLYSWAPEE